MADQKKKGIFSRLFGAPKSCCCNMKIEEVTEDQPGQASPPSAGQSCCGGKQPGKNVSGDQARRPENRL